MSQLGAENPGERVTWVQVAAANLPLICCVALDLFHSSPNLSPLPCPREVEIQRPWPLLEAQGSQIEKGLPG